MIARAYVSIQAYKSYTLRTRSFSKKERNSDWLLTNQNTRLSLFSRKSREFRNGRSRWNTVTGVNRIIVAGEKSLVLSRALARSLGNRVSNMFDRFLPWKWHAAAESLNRYLARGSEQSGWIRSWMCFNFQNAPAAPV